jgi:hypothetical protein
VDAKSRLSHSRQAAFNNLDRMMPGLTLGDHAIPILLILKMRMLRKTTFAGKAGFPRVRIDKCRTDVSHDLFPFCVISEISIPKNFGFVIKLVVENRKFFVTGSQTAGHSLRRDIGGPILCRMTALIAIRNRAIR